ncbi:MAG: hypothetical protein JWP27_1253 [Flaviaesturariibacter sp.]|nr:hypothetical protein [Flaviaesturariibacter sp.]
MKLLLFLLSVLALQTVSAQQTDLDRAPGRLNQLKRLPPPVDIPNAFRYKPLYRGNVLSTTLAPRPSTGVHSLPQDGMPCIVPDVQGLAAIPNAAPLVRLPYPARIPNAYNRERLPLTR